MPLNPHAGKFLLLLSAILGGATWGLAIQAGMPLAAQASPSELPDPLDAGWEGEPVCERLHEDADQRVLRCTFAPSTGHERHFHGRHFGYAIAGGRMRITDARGTREVDLATGSSYSSDGVDWHEVLNVGDTTVVYLIIEPKPLRYTADDAQDRS